MSKEQRTLIREINLLEDKKLIWLLNVAAIVLFFGFLLLFSGVTFWHSASMYQSFNFWTLILGLGLFFVLIIIHELIHALFFKMFQPTKKVKFGFKNGMAYATSPHSYYKKYQFIIICLAPFVLLTSGLVVLYLMNLLSASLFIFLASMHASGCVGDFYFTYLILRAPKNSWIEDTEQGINFYH